jgi:hypothetical protein
MKTAILLAPALAAALASANLVAAAASIGEAEVTAIVRTYNYAGVEDSNLHEARETASRIFMNAGVELRWADCRVPGSDAGAACTDPVAEGRDFVLRLMTSSGPPAADRKIALGESILDRNARGGILITIDPGLVATIARQSSVEVPPLLGRAMAHEIGHLLLGLSQHPRAGLMRAHWSTEELRGLRPADWQFSRREAAQMRQGLLVRARAAN